MKFYFFNSYHQSLMGFQLTWISTGEQTLQLAKANRCGTPELQNALFHSGAVCLVGRSAGDVDYFLLRKINVTDPEGRVWYINMAVEADVSERASFQTLVKAVLLRHEEFLRKLSGCFYAKNEDLSYELDSERFWAYVANTAQHPVEADSFYNMDNVFAGKLLKALTALETLASQEVSLLVPESTLAYFVNQNPVFQGKKIGQNISCKAFGYLLTKDPALYTLEEEAPVKETKKQIDLTDEQQEKMKKVAMGVGAALAVYGAYKLVDYLFGEEK